ncbi:MAG: aldehyde dehydrogenase family protein [Candidatus Solibacter sp.]
MSDFPFGELLADQRWAGKIFTGQWSVANGGAVDVVEPATGRPIASVGLGDATDIAAAAAEAAAAQPAWAARSARDRAEILRQAAALLRHHAASLAVVVARETGGIVPKGAVELREAEAILHSAAALTLHSRGEILQGAVGRMSLARRVPRGVVGVISPFNFPLILSMRAVAPALATGNAVVLKPDTATALAGGFIIARLFEEAGLPAGLLHVIPGGAEAGEALCLHPAVQMIQFTGSTAVGRRVAELAGKTLKKVSLELGGNNALIVLDDANVEAAVNNAAWGAFLHQGQICMASSRVFVHNSIREEFTRQLAAKASHLPAGDPATDHVPLGPMINQRQLNRFHSIIEDSVKAGARLEAGGEYRELFHEATVLSGVKPGMRAFDEESFGPMASIIGFDSDEEALELANRHEGALAAAVISRDVGRAMRVAEQLQAGIVHINDQTVNDEVTNPFGGPGVAGGGSSVGGPADLEEYTRWQWLTIRDTPPQYPF